VLYVAGGQSGLALETATTRFWRLDLSRLGAADGSFGWESLPPWPGDARAFQIVVAQHNGFDECIHLIGGRRAENDPEAAMNVRPLRDVHEFSPARYDRDAYDPATGAYRGGGRHAEPWRRRADLPGPVMGGTAVAVGQAHVFLLSGDSGELWKRADDLGDDRPGFARRSWIYHTITDTWVEGPPTPANQVTTPAVRWDDGYAIAGGETRPRWRTVNVWRIDVERSAPAFGLLNFTVLAVYLLAMVGLGAWFATRSRDTNDYFRGGQRVPWLIAGLSIYATMLSSITYMAIPAKAYAEDWVYLVGNCMILAWDGPSYLVMEMNAVSPFDRSAANGFRCVKYLSPGGLAEDLADPVTLPRLRDYDRETPVSDEVFAFHRRLYAYDRKNLNAATENIDEASPFWSKEKMIYDAAYGNERMSALTTISWRDHCFMWYKDLARSVDYLESRPDVDADRLACLGISWGAVQGIGLLALEERIRTGMLLLGGLPLHEWLKETPEADPINFAPRVTIPMLMLNGRYDHLYPLEPSQKPTVRFLGTPAEHKRHVIYDSEHSLPRNEMIKETLNWLDRYLGPLVPENIAQ
jgi:predicted esterase